MSFSFSELATRRPYAFHVCGTVNFCSIQQSRMLRSARALLTGTGHQQLLIGRRLKTERVSAFGVDIEVRDHRPLIESSLSFPAGYGIDHFVAELNSRVFLWAGTEGGPVRSGKNHIARYAAEGDVRLLRVPTEPLFRLSASPTTKVTFCNSGAARHNNGLPAKRGPKTFVDLLEAERSALEVVELTFMDEVALPEGTMYASGLQSEWRPL